MGEFTIEQNDKTPLTSYFGAKIAVSQTCSEKAQRTTLPMLCAVDTLTPGRRPTLPCGRVQGVRQLSRTFTTARRSVTLTTSGSRRGPSTPEVPELLASSSSTPRSPA